MDKRQEAIEWAEEGLRASTLGSTWGMTLGELYDKGAEDARQEVHEITGEELRDLLYWMEDDITKISVCMDGGLKIKFNEGQWTLPLGTRKGK